MVTSPPNGTIPEHRDWVTRMSKKAFSAAIFTASVLAAGSASAQVAEGVDVGLGLSTLGATLEGSYRVQPQLRVRGIVSGLFSYETSEEFEGAEVSLDASMSGAGLMADYYVTGGNWRVSGGFFAANGELNASGTASASNPFEYGGQTFTSGERLDLSARFANDVSLMLTTGYDFNPVGNWVVSGEIGALLTGGIDLTATGNTAALQSAIDADADVQDAISSAKDIVAYPYLGVTAAFRF